jgi:hypothetical protein
LASVDAPTRNAAGGLRETTVRVTNVAGR